MEEGEGYWGTPNLTLGSALGVTPGGAQSPYAVWGSNLGRKDAQHAPCSCTISPAPKPVLSQPAAVEASSGVHLNLQLMEMLKATCSQIPTPQKL